jgi:hypothetical protein
MLKMVNTNEQYDDIILPLLRPMEVLNQGKATPNTSKK